MSADSPSALALSLSDIASWYSLLATSSGAQPEASEKYTLNSGTPNTHHEVQRV